MDIRFVPAQVSHVWVLLWRDSDVGLVTAGSSASSLIGGLSLCAHCRWPFLMLRMVLFRPCINFCKVSLLDFFSPFVYPRGVERRPVSNKFK